MPKDLLTLTIKDITFLSLGYKRRREIELSDLRLLLAEVRNSSLNVKSITKPQDIIKLSLDEKYDNHEREINEKAAIDMFMKLVKKPNN